MFNTSSWYGYCKVCCEAAMYWDVKTVKPLPDFCIYVEIEDGRKGYLT
jgi:hypothetical protein